MTDWLRELDILPTKVKYSECLPTTLTKLTEPHPPIESVPVQCADCLYFTPDPIGYGGIGDCTMNIEHPTPLYPNTKRKCATFKQEN